MAPTTIETLDYFEPDFLSGNLSNLVEIFSLKIMPFEKYCEGYFYDINANKFFL